MLQHEVLPFLHPIEICKFGLLSKKCNEVVDQNKHLMKENPNIESKYLSAHFEFISRLWLSLTQDELKDLMQEFKSGQPDYYKRCLYLKQFNSYHQQIHFKKDLRDLLKQI